MEGDGKIDGLTTTMQAFLSTPSVWRATGFNTPVYYGIMISIHALRVEGDLFINGVLFN